MVWVLQIEQIMLHGKFLVINNKMLWQYGSYSAPNYDGYDYQIDFPLSFNKVYIVVTTNTTGKAADAASNGVASKAAGNITTLTTTYFTIGKQIWQNGGYWFALGT